MGFRLNYSGIKLFKSCRKRYQFSEIQKLSPIESGESLLLGTAAHKMLELMYKGELVDIDAVVKWIGHYRPTNEGYFNPESVEQMTFWAKTFMEGLLVYDINQFNILGLEVPIQVKITKNTIHGYDIPIDDQTIINGDDNYFYGIIDGVFQHKDTGEIYVHEIKTMTTIPNMSSLVQDEQTAMYCWALSHIMQVPVKNVIFTILKKTYPKMPNLLKSGQLSKDKSQLTTYDLYKQSIIDNGLKEIDYAEHLAMLAGNPQKFIIREELFRSSQDLEDMHIQLMLLFKEIKTVYKRDAFYRNPVEPWRGGCICPYKSICIDDTMEGRTQFVPKPNHYPDVKKFNQFN